MFEALEKLDRNSPEFKKAYRTLRIGAMLDRLDTVRARVKEKNLNFPLPTRDLAAVILDGLLRRDGKTYARPRTMREAPLASIVGRLLLWHGSGGGLWGYFMARDDCYLLLAAALGKYWTDAKKAKYFARDREAIRAEFGPAVDVARRQNLPGTDEEKESRAVKNSLQPVIFDMLDNFALLLRGGHSSAAKAWQRALMGE